MEQAVSVQAEFEKRFGDAQGVVGIGIGLNRSRDDLALNVSVQRSKIRPTLPDTFQGLDVVVNEVGKIRAFSGSDAR